MDAYIVIEKAIEVIFIAAPTAWLTARFATRNYRTDKWFDKKISSYFDVIAALSNLIIYCDSMIDLAYKEIEYSREEIKSLKRKFHDARLHIQAQDDIGRILYGKEAYQALLDLNSHMFLAERDRDEVQRAAEIRKLAEECKYIITANAKIDLGLQSILSTLGRSKGLGSIFCLGK